MNEVRIHEVGLRDGLQAEQTTVPFEKKIAWIDAIMETGVDIIQIGSFVHPVKMPQMADTDKLFEHYSKQSKPKNVILSGLVLNEKGLDRGLACGVEMFCMGVSASDTHSQKNTGMTTMEAAGRIVATAKRALGEGKAVQCAVQSAFGCGFEGLIDENKVMNIVKEYLNAGITKISLADTAGHANPAQVERMFGEILAMAPKAELACHFHNSYGMGLANCLQAIKSGVKNIETAFGGLGGCPFTKSPSGNVCTEDFVHCIQAMGMRKDIDLTKSIQIARALAAFFDRDLPGFVYKTGPIKH